LVPGEVARAQFFECLAVASGIAQLENLAIERSNGQR
jgi:hypothetical protein